MYVPYTWMVTLYHIHTKHESPSCHYKKHITFQQGRTALIAASDSGFVDIVKLLVHKASQFPDEERQKYLDHKKHVRMYYLTVL